MNCPQVSARDVEQHHGLTCLTCPLPVMLYGLPVSLLSDMSSPVLHLSLYPSLHLPFLDILPSTYLICNSPVSPVLPLLKLCIVFYLSFFCPCCPTRLYLSVIYLSCSSPLLHPLFLTCPQLCPNFPPHASAVIHLCYLFFTCLLPVLPLSLLMYLSSI